MSKSIEVNSRRINVVGIAADHAHHFKVKALSLRPGFSVPSLPLCLTFLFQETTNS